jgi:hypothetical protein
MRLGRSETIILADGPFTKPASQGELSLTASLRCIWFRVPQRWAE